MPAGYPPSEFSAFRGYIPNLAIGIVVMLIGIVLAWWSWRP